MATEIINLELEELSLVGKGANQFAKAPIFKADTSKGDKMTDEVIKMSEEMDKKVKDYMKAKDVDRATAEEALMKSLDENERLRKALIEAGYVIKAETIEKKAPEEFIEYEGEKVNKADVPAPILKHLETLEIEKAERAIEKRCKESLPNVKESNARILLKAYDGLEEEQAKEFEEFLRALDAVFDGMTEEVGKTATDDMSDPSEKMDALVTKYADEHNITKAQAYAAVAKTKAGKELVKAIYKKED